MRDSLVNALDLRARYLMVMAYCGCARCGRRLVSGPDERQMNSPRDVTSEVSGKTEFLCGHCFATRAKYGEEAFQE